ncbi:hypothetical protein BU23DRAFT_217504 [Bimuria novae-zelandiae CBS 107.79]|uniref:Uncharacterized protein n=1 Tax=Bimuria novae-zelandiae CBS 107.79 TaxID=1447943 RepID=A0A6A5VA85_9PLEO|nr:hypothetical protein BU23DRAFT_217504 [Bimuria novae-zelandiae CBS 107.79]
MATPTCLPPLKPLLLTVSSFFSHLSPTRGTSERSPTTTSSGRREDSDSDSPPPSPYPQSYSTPTFLSLPRPLPTRFHDHTSDLDFDLVEAPPPTRSRTHSRNPSNLTVLTTFTGFTSGFTVPPFDREVENARPGGDDKGVGERGRGVEGDAGGSGYAVSVTSRCESGDTCEGSEDAGTIRRVGSEGICYAGGGGIVRTTEVRVG